MRRAAEVFADPKVENEVSDDKMVKAKEKVAQNVESIFQEAAHGSRRADAE